MRRFGQHHQVVQPDLAAFFWNQVESFRIVRCAARGLAVVNDGGPGGLGQDLVLAPTLPSNPRQRLFASTIKSRASLSSAGSIELRLCDCISTRRP